MLALAAVYDNRAEARACKRLVHCFLPSDTAAPNDPRTRQNSAGAGSKMVRFPFSALVSSYGLEPCFCPF